MGIKKPNGTYCCGILSTVRVLLVPEGLFNSIQTDKTVSNWFRHKSNKFVAW